MTEAAVQAPHSEYGLWSWLTTVDAKRIGVLYGVTAGIFFLIGGVEALFMRTQLMYPDNTFLSADTFNGLFTVHGVTMIFLFLMPMNAAFFNFMIPLQIGARDVAFPRLNAFSYWVYLLGGLLLVSSFVVGAIPKVGWTGYSNLSSSFFTPGIATNFYIVGLLVLGTSSMAAAINFITTIINMRAPGMTPLRMPIFTWTALVTNFLLLLALPPIAVALGQVLFDRTFGTSLHVPSGGGSATLWQHLFWVFGHPEVYILILPPMGMVSDILPTFSRKPLFGFSAMVYATVAIGFLGFGVWAHHMFTVGMGAWGAAIFSAITMLIAIPTGVKIFNWIFTIIGGQFRMTTAALFAAAFIPLFTLAGLTGIMHSSPPIDWQHQDSYFVVAHFHYVLVAGSVVGIFGGIYYWFPKVTGRMLSETLGKLHFWTFMVGINLTFFPMHFLGVDGMPRRVYTYQTGFNFDTWNFWVTIGAYITGASMLILIFNIFKSLKSGAVAGPDPWDARTLEWSISSPPPEYNFVELPQVTARDDFWHRKYELKNFQPQPDNQQVHMPPPSYWPLITALGLGVFFTGFVFEWYVLPFIGAPITLIAVFCWSFEEFEM